MSVKLPDWVNQFQFRLAKEDSQVPGRRFAADRYRQQVKVRLVNNGLQQSAAVLPAWQKTAELFVPMNPTELEYWRQLSQFPPICADQDHRMRMTNCWSSVCRAVGVLSASTPDAEVEELKQATLARIDYETSQGSIRELDGAFRKEDLRCQVPEVAISWLASELDQMRVLSGGPAHDELYMFSVWLRSQVDAWTLIYWPRLNQPDPVSNLRVTQRAPDGEEQF